MRIARRERSLCKVLILAVDFNEEKEISDIDGCDIRIGDDIGIVVTSVRGNKVRIGIIAPKVIPVHRKKVYEAIQREKGEKAKLTSE